jgi:endoglucanase
VIDTGNQGVSHTEGQGWGLLFAEYFNDQPSFERILSWTASTLGRKADSLYSWRYVPGVANHVPDTNNATDGDLFIAWALARAARRWGTQDHAQTAINIAHDVLRLLTRRVGERLLLLPALKGFDNNVGVVVNPSYYVFLAMAELEALVPLPQWEALRRDGLSVINHGQFGRWMLPPDWLRVDKRSLALSPASRWPARCSFEAIRVPLYLAWARLPAPSISAAYAAFYAPRATGPAPAWVDLKSRAEAPYAASPGMLVVARIAAATSDGGGDVIDFPRVAEAADYYAASLTLLVRIAWRERRAA